MVSREVMRALNENEYRYMSDDDIAAQYDDFKVTALSVEPNRYGEGWYGVIELEFPNADDIDFNSSLVENYFAYDKAGNKIAFDHWYPDAVCEILKDMIRQEIAKRKQDNSVKEGVRRIVDSAVRRALRESRIRR